MPSIILCLRMPEWYNYQQMATSWPAYFYVDNEMYVKLYVVNNKLIGINDLGNPYNISRLPMSPYKKITKEEFDRGSEIRRKEFPIIVPPTGSE
jgi:hypothetical protein